MNTCRKLLSALLCLTLLVSVLPLGAVPARADTLAGDGTPNDPYKIATADDLFAFAAIVNGTDNKTAQPNAWAVLADDIDLNNQAWTPIGNNSNNFIGTFDGGKHTISGLSSINTNSSSTTDEYFGLFGVVGEGGTVKNLTVEGSITVDSTCMRVIVGGIIGWNNDGTVSDCTNNVTVNVTTTGGDGRYVGGIIGRNIDGIVSNCINKGNISVTAKAATVGGVVGENHGPLTDCSNSGTVGGTGQAALVGGIVGINGVGGSVSGCTNNNTVTTSGSNAAAGGVAGNNINTISKCYNTGAVSGPTAGGVAGMNSAEDYSGTVNSCYNTGKVTTSIKGATIGGVVGANGYGNTPGTVNGCYFLVETATSGVGDNSSTNVTNVAAKTDAQFNSGEVAWLLQEAVGGNDSTATQVWGQQLSGEPTDTDKYPVLTSDPDKKVYQVTFKDSGSIFATDYANSGDTVALPKHDPTAGKTFNGWYNQETDGTEYTDPITISDSDLVVYAQFTENTPAAGTGYRIDFTDETATAESGYEISTDGTEFSSGPLTITPGDTLYVRYEGNTTAVAENEIDDRPKAPDLSINTANEGVTLSDDYYYSFTSADYGNDDWIQGNGALVTVEPGDTIYIYLAATDKAFKSAVQTLTAPERGAAPTLPTIVYGSETLSGTTTTIEYRVGANDEWKRCTDEDMSVTEWMGQTVYFRTAATNGNYASAPVSLTIPARPVAPSVQGVNESIAGSNDGKITGLTAGISYELSSNDGQTWTDVAAGSTEITDLAPGTYQVRIKAGTNSFASAAASVTVENGATPTYTVTVSANPAEGGTVSGGGEATEGTKVTVTATPEDGYHFVRWTENDTTVSTAASYTFDLEANRTLIAVFEQDQTPTPDPDPTPTPDPDPSGPSTGESDGWESIADEITAADDGDSITIDMNGETEVPADIFEDLAGKDVDLVFDMGDGLSWSVNGQDIPTDADLSDLDLGVDLGTDGIPVDVINAITGELGSVQITLAYDGEFGFTLTLTAPLGEDNAGYWANLYHYDEDAEAMNFEAAAEIGADGSVSLPLSHASQYVIVIDDHSHAATDVSEIFTDVPANHWAQAAIQYVYDNGLMTGVSDSEFAPEATTTRAMIVSMLARMEGVTSAADAGFADVAADDWYATAANWAAANGIVNGISDDTFAPNDPITREQLAAMLMNYAHWKGQDTSARADLSDYTDQPSTWAKDVVSWAVAEGLLNGVTDDQLQPQGQATRAQVAAILERFIENAL